MTPKKRPKYMDDKLTCRHGQWKDGFCSICDEHGEDSPAVVIPTNPAEEVMADLVRAVARIEELESKVSRVQGWREWDHPEGFCRFTAQWIVDNLLNKDELSIESLDTYGECEALIRELIDGGWYLPIEKRENAIQLLRRLRGDSRWLSGS